MPNGKGYKIRCNIRSGIRKNYYSGSCLNCDKIYRYNRNLLRREIDILYKIKNNISSLVRISIKNGGKNKNTKTTSILGCSILEFKLFIESKFLPWMSWDNWGKYTGSYNETWQLDHIIPISQANNEYDLIKLNHYTNYQPLCSKINQVDKSSNNNWT